ncbi:MAG TPA: hypothetical protein DIC53_11160 [Synergistaceae bacterium]|jgi:hypothetical protein|nr:hypothetical protein [Synergistaceae bacterium]
MNRRTIYFFLCLVTLSVIAGTLLRLRMTADQTPAAQKVRILFDPPHYAAEEAGEEDISEAPPESALEDGTGKRVPRSGARTGTGGSDPGPSAAELEAIARGIRPRSGTPGDMSKDLEEMERERQRREKKSLDEIKREAQRKREPSIFDPTW